MSQHAMDDINFHEFLANMRREQQLSLATLGEGLYSESMMKRIEIGERLPRKLERERIVARLGVSSDKYEDYLPRDDYAWWEQRQEIIRLVENRDWKLLQNAIANYKDIQKRTNVEEQFLDAMWYMKLKLTGASEKELADAIRRAVSYTVPCIQAKFPEKLLLSPQEINLLIEYARYGGCREKEEIYNSIFRYIENSCMDQIGKSKVFPKAVYYECTDAGVSKDTNYVKERMEKCMAAVELLRDTRRMYYLQELLELSLHYMEELQKNDFNESKESSWKEMQHKYREWLRMFRDLYREYDLEADMENFCYLYHETESHCINDVIGIRRNMLGLTQEKLAGEVCSVKTLRRIEKYRSNPQIYEVRGLFQTLGLCPEYVRANVITQDPAVMKLHREVIRYANERKISQYTEAMEQLETRLCMEIPQNRQAVERERLLLAFDMKQIDEEEFNLAMRKVLEITVPVESVSVDQLYFTIEEINCLFGFSKVRENKYMNLLVEYCEKDVEEEYFVTRQSIYELVITGLASYLGNIGEYQKSKEWSDKMVRFGLKQRRVRTLARNLYNNLWIEDKIAEANKGIRNAQNRHQILKRCILLSEFVKNDTLKFVFESKLID